MKKTIVFEILAWMVWSGPIWADDASIQIQTLNNQIQTQLQGLHSDQQTQLKKLNDALQAQMAQMQTSLQGQIQTVNDQVKTLASEMQKQLQAVENSAPASPAK